MFRRTTLCLLLLTAFVVPQITAQTGSGTSSTGDVDTWGVMNNVPYCLHDPQTPETPDPTAIPMPSIFPIRPGTINLGDAIENAVAEVRDDPCIMMWCPADLFVRMVTLELIDPSPVDKVAITVVGETPAYTGSFPANNPGSYGYPSAVATYDSPKAQIPVQLGGCNRATTVAVTGIIVEGEVAYDLYF